jgi:hypothetical protein
MQITTIGFTGGVYVLPLTVKDVVEMEFIMYFFNSLSNPNLSIEMLKRAVTATALKQTH